MGTPIRVSRHREVFLTITARDKKCVPVTGDIPLILEEELTINLESQYAQLYQGSDSSIISAVGSTLRAMFGAHFSGQHEGMGFQVWKSTSPLSLNLPFTFHVGMAGKYNAKEEVYKPMLALMKLPLPEAGAAGFLAPPGPTLASIAQENGPAKTNLFVDQVLSLKIAKILSISNVIVKRAEPTWANEFDESGYPIWGKISLEIESVLTATVNLLDFNDDVANTNVPTQDKPEPRMTILDEGWDIGGP